MSDAESTNKDLSKNYSLTEAIISNELQKIHRLNDEETYKKNAPSPSPSPINQQLTINTTISDESCNYNMRNLEQTHSDNECCLQIMSSTYDSDYDNHGRSTECNDTLYNTDRINEIASPTSSTQSKDDILLSKLHNSPLFLICNLSIYSILGVSIRYFISELFYSGCENGKFACVTSMQSPIFVDLPANSE